MADIIEYIKIIGAFLGPILGAIALILQRAGENRRGKIIDETSLSGDARQWAEDFREEMRLVKEESSKARVEAASAQKDALDCRLQLLTAERTINDLKEAVRKLSEENNKLTADLRIVQERNKTLEVEMQTLTTQNVKLGKEVITLQQENSALRSTVEQQALQIEQLQEGKGKETT